MSPDLSPDSYLQKGSTSVVNGPNKCMLIAILVPIHLDFFLISHFNNFGLLFIHSSLPVVTVYCLTREYPGLLR